MTDNDSKGRKLSVVKDGDGVESLQQKITRIADGARMRLDAEMEQETSRIDVSPYKNIEQAVQDGLQPHRRVIPFERLRGTLHYPSLMARVPIFKATKDRTTWDRNWDNPEILVTAWGTLRRWGPGINISDMETLMALFALCKKEEHSGPRGAFRQTRIPDKTSMSEEDIAVLESWFGQPIVTLGGSTDVVEICKYLGDSKQFKTRKMRRDSIMRLRQVRLIHEVVKGTKMLKPAEFIPPSFVDAEGRLKTDFEWDEGFFYYAGDPSVDGEFHIQFTPIITELLKSFTSIDLEIFRALDSNYGPLMYAFLSSVMTTKTKYEIGSDKFASVVGFGSINPWLNYYPEDWMYQIRQFKPHVKKFISEHNSLPGTKFKVGLIENGRGQPYKIAAYR